MTVSPEPDVQQGETTTIYCPGCDSRIQAAALICPTCNRCPGCGRRRNTDDGPCPCGHPNDAAALARLVESNRQRSISSGWIVAVLLVVIAVAVAIAALVR